jgi:hypothetical protein
MSGRYVQSENSFDVYAGKCYTKYKEKIMVQGFIKDTIPMHQKRVGGIRRPVICEQNGNYYKSCFEASDHLGMSRESVAMIVGGHRKTSRGFSFRYATDEEIKKAEG